MTVSFNFTRGKLIIAPVRVCHRAAREPVMALDTGARLTVITPTIAAELGFSPGDLEPSVRMLGATGSGDAALIRVRSISILGLEAANVRVLCHPLPAGLQLDGILGLDFLRDFDIQINNSTETVTLTRWRE